MEARKEPASHSVFKKALGTRHCHISRVKPHPRRLSFTSITVSRKYFPTPLILLSDPPCCPSLKRICCACVCVCRILIEECLGFSWQAKNVQAVRGPLKQKVARPVFEIDTRRSLQLLCIRLEGGKTLAKRGGELIQLIFLIKLPKYVIENLT